MTRADEARDYHCRAKHHPQRYAASLGFLDWATQPDPFRRHEGAPRVRLPFRSSAPSVAWGQAPLDPPAPLDLSTLGDFLRHSLGLSAWKHHGTSRWALRVNPSSGNLHPVEGHVVLPPLAGVSEAPVVAHHATEHHGLEIRARLPQQAWEAFASTLPPGAFLVGLSSITWREAWKYGERAFRYCQHDTGHALAALSLSASFLGWRVTRLPSWSSAQVAGLLGLDRAGERPENETEEAQLLAVVHPQDTEVSLPSAEAAAALVAAAQHATWMGLPNVLSKEHAADWPVTDAVGLATRHDGRSPIVAPRLRAPRAALAASPGAVLDARALVLRRRSAVAMDGRTGISLAAFQRLVARLLPTAHAPWTALAHAPSVHLFLFVHRVEGIVPGLLALVRDEAALPRLREATHAEFTWERPPGIDLALPLYRLAEGDAREAAQQISCGQAIAADGAFSFGMIADYSEVIDREGPSAYRELFWETGALGQVAYLEAEAAGLSATGIGCYFDDLMHRLLGLEGDRFQSLYHFTIGGSVHDARLASEPGYADEGRR